MAQTHFNKLDDESRALHDSWDHIARIVTLLALLAALVWAACSLLRWSVHVAFETLLEFVEEAGVWGPLTLLLVLGAVVVGRGPMRQSRASPRLEASRHRRGVTTVGAVPLRPAVPASHLSEPRRRSRIETV